jgi:hypothetical protein
MTVYTVHEPARRGTDLLAHTDRFVFVRDGFSWAAFLFGPLWMLRHRLWLAVVLYLVVATAFGAIVRAAGLPSDAAWASVALLALLIGLDASSLRRRGLARRGWTNLGGVVADDLELAERRYFDAWVLRGAGRPGTPGPIGGAMSGAAGAAGSVASSHLVHAGFAASHPGAAHLAPRHVSAGAPDVIGLFPEPGARP